MIPTDSIDKAYEAFLKLLTEVKQAEGTFFSEADTRIKIIDDILIDVLGWPKSDLLTEEQAGKGFLDYKLSLDGKASVIVEAKRVSRTFELSNRENGADYKLSGSVFKHADANEGILQAIQYSAFKGTELACVTNGREWIIFRSNRIGDGTDTLEGKAFVFTSLEGIRDQFNLFHDLLSREAVSSLVFRALFQEAEGRIIRHPHFKKRLRTADSAHFLVQPDIVPALDRVMTTFFQRLTNDSDLEMLEECFVETRESKAAEQKLLRLAEALVGTIRGLNTGSGDQLVELLERAKASKLNQFILIVGTKGAGKSTFIQRFFHLKLPGHLSQACVPIVINLANSDGDEHTVIEWLRKEALEKAENALGGGTPTWDEIVGHMFFAEYQRWSTGSMKNLYEKDKQEFKIQFGNYIENIPGLCT